MLTKTGIKIRICSSTGKGTQHLEQDSKFPELLPSAPQVLDGPRRPRDRLQPLRRTCPAKFALRAEPTLSVAGDGSTTSAGMVPGQPRSRPGSGTARGGCRGALGAAEGLWEPPRVAQSGSVKVPPRAWKSFLFHPLREERGTPASCASHGEVTSWKTRTRFA